MAPNNHSRKGKKAWRKNIDATEVEAFIEEETTKERRGPAADTLADDQLFFVDTSADKEEAKAVQEGKQRKRKLEAKPLRALEIIERAHKAKKVIDSLPIKPVNNLTSRRNSSSSSVSLKSLKKLSALSTRSDADLRDLWADVPVDPKFEIVNEIRPPKRPCRPVSSTNKVKAVEVDAAGCSYNPDFEQHQDALATVVAKEMNKILKAELYPVKAIPFMVPSDGKSVSELDQYLEDLGGDEEDENELEEEEEGVKGVEGEGSEAVGSGSNKNPKLPKKKTKKDRLRDERRRAEEAVGAQKRALKKQRKDVENIKELLKEVVEEEAAQKVRLERKQADVAEKEAYAPPKLGKHKFQPRTPTVLTSDELTGGCLRRLSASPMGMADRFKSLQHRGLLEPRVKVGKTKSVKIVYEKNARREKAEAGQAEIREMQQKTKELRKKIKKDQEKLTDSFY
uniref:Ribosome biogenesis protein NOP53 n=1 Tax=Polytomella parva TaxID=51329 RepID=A0A7S0VWI6_9CHLO|mmetsp:Transcript_8587/g.16392  ORF Transcript_8587/g.16392 Transcript_8587/m.16392 type:complete len:453 (+) Transcript_8587:62-1420(+)